MLCYNLSLSLFLSISIVLSLSLYIYIYLSAAGGCEARGVDKQATIACRQLHDSIQTTITLQATTPYKHIANIQTNN